jgi:GNAT superfamily N-acetyltransferase
MRGYGITGGELYINWTDFADQLQRLQADAAAMPEGVTVTVEDFYWDDDRKTPLPSTRTLAIDADGETLGICETIASNEYPLRPSINVSSRPPDSVSIYDTFVGWSRYDDHQILADTCFVSWLGVPAVRENLNTVGYDVRAPTQGQGLGKALLSRSLLEMHARGYRHSIISTDLTNHRGQMFYTNFGYTASDWTNVYSRALGPEAKL